MWWVYNFLVASVTPGHTSSRQPFLPKRICLVCREMSWSWLWNFWCRYNIWDKSTDSWLLNLWKCSDPICFRNIFSSRWRTRGWLNRQYVAGKTGYWKRNLVAGNFSARVSRWLSVTSAFSLFVLLRLLGFFPAFFGPLLKAISRTLGPFLEFRCELKNSLNVLRTFDTQEIVFEKYFHLPARLSRHLFVIIGDDCFLACWAAISFWNLPLKYRALGMSGETVYIFIISCAKRYHFTLQAKYAQTNANHKLNFRKILSFYLLFTLYLKDGGWFDRQFVECGWFDHQATRINPGQHAGRKARG